MAERSRQLMDGPDLGDHLGAGGLAETVKVHVGLVNFVGLLNGLGPRDLHHDFAHGVFGAPANARARVARGQFVHLADVLARDRQMRHTWVNARGDIGHISGLVADLGPLYQ